MHSAYDEHYVIDQPQVVEVQHVPVYDSYYNNTNAFIIRYYYPYLIYSQPYYWNSCRHYHHSRYYNYSCPHYYNSYYNCYVYTGYSNFGSYGVPGPHYNGWDVVYSRTYYGHRQMWYSTVPLMSRIARSTKPEVRQQATPIRRDVKPQRQLEPKPEIRHQPQRQVERQPQPEIRHQPQRQLQPKPEIRHQPQRQLQPKPEIRHQPQRQLQPKPEIRHQPQRQVERQHQPQRQVTPQQQQYRRPRTQTQYPKVIPIKTPTLNQKRPR